MKYRKNEDCEVTLITSLLSRFFQISRKCKRTFGTPNVANPSLPAVIFHPLSNEGKQMIGMVKFGEKKAKKIFEKIEKNKVCFLEL